jgi:hypothetical protein
VQLTARAIKIMVVLDPTAVAAALRPYATGGAKVDG